MKRLDFLKKTALFGAVASLPAITLVATTVQDNPLEEMRKACEKRDYYFWYNCDYTPDNQNPKPNPDTGFWSKLLIHEDKLWISMDDKCEKPTSNIEEWANPKHRMHDCFFRIYDLFKYYRKSVMS